MKISDKNNVENIVSLAPIQEGILYDYLKNPDDNLYFEQLCLNLSLDYDEKAFRDTWAVIVKNNDMLRTIFRWINVGNPMQIILKNHDLPIEIHDLTHHTGNQKHHVINEIIEKDKQNKFDLHHVPFRITLCRMSEKDFTLIITSHHIIFDGWSSSILVNEFITYYTALYNKQQLPTNTKSSYTNFIKWLKQQDDNHSRDYWNSYLKGFDNVTLQHTRSDHTDSNGSGSVKLSLPEELGYKIEQFVKKNHLTISTLLYSVWAILLSRYTGSEDIIFGTTVSLRPKELRGIDSSIGLYINTLPLRVTLPADQNIHDHLTTLHKSIITRNEFKHTSLDKIKTFSKINKIGNIFNYNVVIENYPFDKNAFSNNETLFIKSFTKEEKTSFDITLLVKIFKGMELEFLYKKELFDKNFIENLSQRYNQVLLSIIDNSDKTLSDIGIFMTGEKEHMIVDFNNTKTPYPDNTTLHEIFESQVEQHPDSIALIDGQETLTYKALHNKIMSLASALRKMGIKKNSIVGVLMDCRSESIISIFSILKAGGAFMPINPDWPRNRIETVIKDSNIDLLLTLNEFKNHCNSPGDVMCIDEFFTTNSQDMSNEQVTNINTSDDIAYIIYTSGSTGTPKGVLIEHKSIINYIRWSIKQYLKGESVTFPFYTSLTFDLTLTSFLVPLLSGNTVAVYRDNNEHLAIEQIINDNVVDVIKLTPSHLKLINAPMQNTKIKRLIVGGEALSTRLATEIYNNFNKSVEIYNEYGPTEGTVGCMIYQFNHDETGYTTVPIGKPIDNLEIYVLDAHKKPVPLDVPGELYIGGAGVARGYLNKPQLTADRFVPDCIHNTGKTLYKTGDIVKWITNDTIQFIGRNDNQVKLNGYRIELSEIENILIQHENVKDAIVLLDDRTSNHYLCAFIIPNGSADDKAIRTMLIDNIPDYMIPKQFIIIEEIPLTQNGKVDTSALLHNATGVDIVIIPPETEIEKKLHTIWSEILHINKEDIGITSNFFMIKGNSLNGIRMISRIYKEFNLTVPLRTIFTNATIRELAQYIENELKETGEKNTTVTITTNKTIKELDLSPPQKSMFILQQSDPESTGYNLTQVLVLKGIVDKKRLENSFRQLIERHESLRTSFKIENEVPIQVINDTINFTLAYSELNENDIPEKINTFTRPFDLSKAPLLRIELIKINNTKHYLCLDMHHIVTDGLSEVILINDLMALYQQKELPALTYQYKDFVLWRQDETFRQRLKEQELYWENIFKDEIQPINLPLDFERPRVRTFIGQTIDFEIDSKHREKINALLKDENISDFMFYYSIYILLLTKISGDDDIITGFPTAGRKNEELYNIVGLFVNTLAIRSNPDGEKPFTHFLKELKKIIIDALDNQDYYFYDLTKKIVKDRQLNRNPIFDVFFLYENIEKPQYILPGLEITHYPVTRPISKFDLSLIIARDNDAYRFQFEYNTLLFKKETITMFITYFNKILSCVLDTPMINIKDITISHQLKAAAHENKKIQFNF